MIKLQKWYCDIAIESLSIYIEHVLFKLSKGMPSRIKDNNHLLYIVHNMNSMFLPANAIFVSFDIANVFPNIDNKSGLHGKLCFIKKVN